MTLPSRIVFLEVPPSLRGRIESLHHHDHPQGREPGPGEEEFSIDPAIPLPVELPPGDEKLNLEELSWEMILSGMIKVVSAYALGDAGNREDALAEMAASAGAAAQAKAEAGATAGAAASAGAAAQAKAEAGATAGAAAQAKAASVEVKPDWIGYYRRFVLAVKPEIPQELTEAAILKAKNGNFDLALEILADLEGLFPGSPTVLLNRALALEDRAAARERAGRDQAADADAAELRRAWERVLALDPPFANGLFNAGFFYLRERDYRRAGECFAQYLPLADDPDKKAEAESILREITEKALDDESFREAWERIQAGKEAEGLDFIRDFLERNSGVREGWFVLGWALRRLGRWADGAAALRKALELGDPEQGLQNTVDLRNELAICLMEQNDLPGARKELETALRTDPENVKIISNLGVLALKTGRHDEAAGFFRTVLELSPDDPVARGYLS